MPVISADYFDVFKIPVVRGRKFTRRDGPGAPIVAIVNQAMARQFWPNDDAIGARLSLGSKTASESSATDPKTLEIVGVAGDVRERTDRSTDPRRNTIYIPVAQNSDGFTAYILRNPAIWMIRTRVEPHSLEQRAKEIGIRIALGASNVQTIVIRQGMQLVLVGTAIRRRRGPGLDPLSGEFSLWSGSAGSGGLHRGPDFIGRRGPGRHLAPGATSQPRRPYSGPAV